MRSFVKCILILCTINFSAFPQQLKSEIEKLSKDADVILTGKVKDQKSEWNNDQTKILTKVKINVDEYLKSDINQQEITVTHLGGEVGEVGELYSHTPKFTGNEDVLLFLKKDKQDNYKVLYGEEGKLTLYEDKLTGEKVTSSKEKVSTLKSEIKKYINSAK